MHVRIFLEAKIYVLTSFKFLGIEIAFIDMHAVHLCFFFKYFRCNALSLQDPLGL